MVTEVDNAHALEQEITELRAENVRLKTERDQIRQQLDQLLRQIYGRRRERFDGHPELPFDEPDVPPPPHIEEAADDECDEDAAPTRRKRRRGAPRLSDDIPRVEETIEPTDEERSCSCCGKDRHVIGYEETRKLEYTPANCYLRVIRRPKLVCKDHEEAGVTTPDLPPQAVHKGLAGETMLAQVVTAKYRDHLPLYRQAGIYRRQGIDIPESSLGDWVRQSADLLKPITKEILAKAIASKYVSTDDTSVTVLAPGAGKKKSKRAFLWVYVGSDPGDVFFDFTLGRSREGPKRVLADFEGTLQSDAYSVYAPTSLQLPIVNAGCMAHARRRFFDAQDTDRTNAQAALAGMRELYAVEREYKTLAAKDSDVGLDTRLAMRQERARPIFDSLRGWLVGLKRQVLPKSPIGKAVGYFVSNADTLERYLIDPEIEIDNNRCERAMRQVAVGRKNWLFTGSAAGGERAAILYSLTVGCWELGLDPFEYLSDVLKRISVTPCSEIGRLTPRGWKLERDSR
jgi:transposase